MQFETTASRLLSAQTPSPNTQVYLNSSLVDMNLTLTFRSAMSCGLATRAHRWQWITLNERKASHTLSIGGFPSQEGELSQTQAPSSLYLDLHVYHVNYYLNIVHHVYFTLEVISGKWNTCNVAPGSYKILANDGQKICIQREHFAVYSSVIF